MPNRANELLPDWLRVRGEFRERVEGFTGAGFVEERDDAYSLSRLRLNATLFATRWLSFQTQVQDARVARKDVGPTGPPFRGPFDLRTAFADVGPAKGHVTARIGRQELVFGEQRLVGHLGWANTARTFDAAKLTLRSKRVQVDAFGASVVRVLEHEFDRSGSGNRFAGAYVTTSALHKSSLEPYVFWRRDRNQRMETGSLRDLTVTTVGVRWVGSLPAYLDYGTELAVQAGSVGTDSVDAWAGHWQLRESLPGSGAVHLIAEYNFASGDRNPADGKRGTFDQLYPTGHDKYGLADQVGWRNIRHVRGGVDTTPWKKITVGVNYHSWWLAQSRDALYTAGGAPLARVAAGARSTHVGQEIDVQAARALTPQLQLSGGYAHVFPGGFLKQATPGTGHSFPYIMATYVFLAEK